MKFKVACVQNCATNNLDETISDALDLSVEASNAGADLICLPEFFSFLDIDENGLSVAPYPESEHPTLSAFQVFSRTHKTWGLLGSIAVYDEHNRKRNRSILLDSTGDIVARYDKIHMFDVNLPNGEIYRESDIFAPGEAAVTAQLPWCTMGLTVCYDLRFPHLFRTLAKAGAGLISMPAAFTRTTGQVHWHVMLRSRAIETGAYIVAPCQFGDHGKARTYGHSLIVDPWGRVLEDAGEDRRYIISELDTEEVEKARRMIPALRNDRNYTEPAQNAPQLLRQAS